MFFLFILSFFIYREYSDTILGVDELGFYVLINNVSVKSRRWENDSIRLCGMEPPLRLEKISSLADQIWETRSAVQRFNLHRKK